MSLACRWKLRIRSRGAVSTTCAVSSRYGTSIARKTLFCCELMGAMRSSSESSSSCKKRFLRRAYSLQSTRCREPWASSASSVACVSANCTRKIRALCWSVLPGDSASAYTSQYDSCSASIMRRSTKNEDCIASEGGSEKSWSLFSSCWKRRIAALSGGLGKGTSCVAATCATSSAGMRSTARAK
eukprot:6194928-Pleurochrysis_carterae.AAC.3